MNNCPYTIEELEKIFRIKFLADKDVQYDYDNSLYYKCEK